MTYDEAEAAMNPLHLFRVKEDLDQRGIKFYTLRPGNPVDRCIWVSYNQLDCYYVFNDKCQVVDIIYD